MLFKKKIKPLVMLFLLILPMFITAINSTVNAVSGDDPGVTISGPDTITTNQQVELSVTLSSSAGNLSEDGDINVVIPKSIVKSSGDLVNNLVIDDPFYLGSPAVVTNENGDYVLNVKYDHTKIDQNSAFGATFKVKFQAPVINNDNNSIPDNVDFSVDLLKNNDKLSSDSTSSSIIRQGSGNTQLQKFSTRPRKNINGVNTALMSLTNPASNIFAITVNYNQKNISNASLVDKTPAGTELTDPGHYIPATGDDTIYKHFRIAKVTSRGTDNLPNGWEYVTEQFKDKITITDDGFKIDFGDLTPDDSYVVMYAEEVTAEETPSEFGIRYNHVDLLSNNNQINNYDTAIALDDTQYQALSLTKKVEQRSLSTTNASLEYSLTAKSINGVIPAGTVISDPLPDHTSFIKTTEKNDEYISDVSVDKDTNTVSYRTLKDITVGQDQTIKFKVLYDDSAAHSGEKIINKAFINYEGTNIYSNDATTILDGSAILKKLDSKDNSPLTGAVFKIVDKSGNTIAENLVSDSDGIVKSGLLKPGEYAFIETKAPDGYALDTTRNNFTVNSGQETSVALTMFNSVATSISGNKTWVDNNDQLGLRPKNITIDLYQNGLKVASTTASKETNWKYSFNDLPEYDKNGNKYSYEVKEQPVTNYESSKHGNDFVNTLESQIPYLPDTSDKQTLEELVKPENRSDSLPNTGSKQMGILTLLGSLMIIIATSFIYFKK